MFFNLNKSLVRPIAEYGNVIWGPSQEENGLLPRERSIAISGLLLIFKNASDWSVIGNE